MRKRRFAAACAVFLILAVLIAAAPAVCAHAAEGAARPELSLEISTGSIPMRDGRTACVTVRLIAKEEARVRLVLREESAGEPAREEVWPLHLPAGETVRQVLTVRMDSSVGQTVCVLSESGEELARKSLLTEAEGTRYTDEFWTGLLPAAAGELTPLDGADLGGYLMLRGVPMTARSIPETEAGLDGLDLLIADGAALEGLSRDRFAALADWMRGGGVLVLGTGDQTGWEPLLDVFGASAQEPILDNTAYGLLSETARQYVNDWTDWVREITIPGAMVHAAEGGIPIAQEVRLGDGGAIVLGFRISHLLTFLETAAERTQMSLVSPSEWIREMLTDSVLLSGNAAYGRIRSGRVHYSDDPWFRRMTVAESGRADPSAPLRFLPVLIVYILIAGPAAYLLLRRIRRRSWLPALITLAAVVFFALISGTAYRTRPHEPFLTYASFITQQGTGRVSRTAFSLRSPYRQDYTVTLNGAEEDGTVSPERLDDPERAQPVFVQATHDGAQTQLSVAGARPYEESLFWRESREDADALLAGELRRTASGIEGSLTWNGQQPLEHAVLVSSAGLIRLGTIGPGETVRVEADWSAHVWDSESALFFSDAGAAEPDPADAALDGFFLEFWRETCAETVCAAGLLPSDEAWEAGCSAPVSGRAVYCQRTEPADVPGERIETEAWRRSRVTQGQTDGSRRVAYTDRVECVYYPDPTWEIGQICFLRPAGEEAAEEPAAGGWRIRVYQPEIGDWVTVPEGAWVYARDLIDPESGAPQLTVRYEWDGPDSPEVASGNALMPQPVWKEGDADAGL